MKVWRFISKRCNAWQSDTVSGDILMSTSTGAYTALLWQVTITEQSKSHVNGVPTKLLFQYVASMIYTGDLNENIGFR